MRRLIILFFLSISISLKGTNYYVKNSGSDSNTGLTDAQAWKSLAKVNKSYFSHGDVIYFKMGDTWRETLTVPSSGKPDNYITFTSYGSGNKPRILGSAKALAFSDQGNNIWKSATSVSDPWDAPVYQNEIFFESPDGSVKMGTHKINAGSMTSEYDWTWSGNYIYVYASSDPDTRYASVEIPQRESGIVIGNKEYTEYSGFEMRYCQRFGIYSMYPQPDVHGLIIDNCNISDMGDRTDQACYGINAMHNDMVVRNCIIHSISRRAISLNSNAPGIKFKISNILIENNTFYDGKHTTGVDISIGGGTNATSFDSVIIRRNLFYDDPQNNDRIKSNFCSEL